MTNVKKLGNNTSTTLKKLGNLGYKYLGTETPYHIHNIKKLGNLGNKSTICMLLVESI